MELEKHYEQSQVVLPIIVAKDLHCNECKFRLRLVAD